MSSNTARGPNLKSLDFEDLKSGRASLTDFAARLREGLESTGLVALRQFVLENVRPRFTDDFLAASSGMKPSGSGSKYSLKYDDITGHEIVRLASGPELLALVNETLRVSPVVCPPLEVGNVKVGYSITSRRGDHVPFHFDHLCVLNILVPVVLPNSIEEEPATLSVWPNLLSFETNLKHRVLTKASLLASRTPLRKTLPLVEYVYRAGDALAFYGSRSLHGVFARRTDGLRAVASINYRHPELAAVS
jgi:hypothetical protein